MVMRACPKLSLSLLAAVTLSAVGCKPDFGGRFSSITEPTILAARSSPAQARPADKVNYRVLVAGPEGTVGDPAVDWSFCTARKPVGEINDVPAACFQAGEDVIPLGSGPGVSGKLPSVACRQFGPDIPSSKPGEPPGRPTDSDATGGYYQPVVLAFSGADRTTLDTAQTRLVCGLANSTAAQLLDFQRRSKPNENPAIVSVTLPAFRDAPLAFEGSDEPSRIAAGQQLHVQVRWPECPTVAACGDSICSPGETAASCSEDCADPHGCAGSEPYLYLDPLSRQLVDRREAMRVSWFASAGTFRDDHTGHPEEEAALLTSDNVWTAPTSPTALTMWIVLRDDRGGVDWQSFSLRVE